jgi:hypothetical protein
MVLKLEKQTDVLQCIPHKNEIPGTVNETYFPISTEFVDIPAGVYGVLAFRQNPYRQEESGSGFDNHWVIFTDGTQIFGRAECSFKQDQLII